MADRKPLKVLPDGGGDSTGLGEFVEADTIGVVDGGTGLGSVGADQLLTGNGTLALTSESNLTFDGTTLVNTGQGIGVGEAPSTWSSGFDFIQIGGTLALASQPGVQASQSAWIVQNAHYDSDGSWEYQATDEAHRIGMSSGNITFDNAASGTAGNDITWSERMRIDPSGNLGVGSNDPDSSAPTGSATPRILKVAGGTSIDKALQIQGYNDDHGLDLWTDVSTGDAYIDQRGDHNNYDMHFRTKTTGTPINAMTITGGGNVVLDESDTNVASGFLTVENTANNQSFYVGARNTGFTQHVIRAFCYRTANSAYNFLDCQSDMAGSNDTEFKLRGDGEAYADGSWNNSGADYQEFFESSDGSALEVGKSVVMDGDKVRVYNASSDSADNIIGVVRPKADNKNSAVIGNTAWNHWTDKYLTDDWGVYLREDVTVWEWDDVMATESDVVEAADATYYEEGDDIPEDKEVGDVKTAEVVGVAVGDVVIKAGSCYERNELAKDSEWTPPAGATSSTQSVRKRNPDYDEERTYAPREERDEWNLIGLLGQVQIKANEPTRPTWIKMKQISDAVDLWLVR